MNSIKVFSDFDIATQESSWNIAIDIITSKLQNGQSLKLGLIAVTTDQHGDFLARLSSFIDAGLVFVRPNDFTYYSIEKDIYLDSSEFKQLAKEERIGFFAFPTPYPNPNFRGDYYDLGDSGGRGLEGVVIFAFTEKLIQNYIAAIGINPIHLAIGNHESFDCGAYNSRNGDVEYLEYQNILGRLISSGYMKTGYIIQNGNKPIALWHSAFNTVRLSIIFKEIKLFIEHMMDPMEEYPTRTEHNRILLYKSIKKEFDSQNPELLQKLINFIADNGEDYDFKNIGTILSNFSSLELAEIKIILGDGLMKCNIGPNGKLLNGRNLIMSMEIWLNHGFLVSNIEQRGDRQIYFFGTTTMKI